MNSSLGKEDVGITVSKNDDFCFKIDLYYFSGSPLHNTSPITLLWKFGHMKH